MTMLRSLMAGSYRGQTTVELFKNKKPFKNICDAKKLLSLLCNTRITTVKKIGDLKGNRMVWYYEDGIANILSMSSSSLEK